MTSAFLESGVENALSHLNMAKAFAFGNIKWTRVIQCIMDWLYNYSKIYMAGIS